MIMLVHTDPKLQKAIVLSFPRDLWVNIPGMGMDKINAAFSGGLDGVGAQRVAKTVEQLTGLKINHVLYVDLAGFQGIVDTLGGVTMCIPTAMTDPLTGLDVKAGCQTLNGYQALAYVRTRHQPCDLVPDFARIGRQQQFLRAVLNRLLSPGEIAKAPSLIRPVARNLVADQGFDLADVVYLVKQLEGISTGAVEFRAVPGVGGNRGIARRRAPRPGRRADLRADPAGQAARRPRPEPGRDGSVGGEHRRSGRRSRFGGDGGEGRADPERRRIRHISRDRRLRDVRRRREGIRDRVQARAPERRARSCRSTSRTCRSSRCQGERAAGAARWRSSSREASSCSRSGSGGGSTDCIPSES